MWWISGFTEAHLRALYMRIVVGLCDSWILPLLELSVAEFSPITSIFCSVDEGTCTPP